ncbi:DEAD/DEAH box helicase family protein [Streptomyces sp. NRRL S-1824]|uniref:DEAD/DEAH box helicase family protein n=1 Tax=Streptomyces sp. NRRL S-1824 TaxID=1463889 RepID=UPI002D21AE80|nr:DEAD/DEAH box helicase family protein [Streptomyces sp. NRRL S-1824]
MGQGALSLCDRMAAMVTPAEVFPSRHPQRPSLRPDQVQGLGAVVRHLRRSHTRALYVAATGTGKTLVSIRAADELAARLVLVVVQLTAPSPLTPRAQSGPQAQVVAVYPGLSAPLPSTSLR